MNLRGIRNKYISTEIFITDSTKFGIQINTTNQCGETRRNLILHRYILKKYSLHFRSSNFLTNFYFKTLYGFLRIVLYFRNHVSTMETDFQRYYKIYCQFHRKCRFRIECCYLGSFRNIIKFNIHFYGFIL